MPFISSTILTYPTQAHYHLIPIDENIDKLKKIFNLLVLLPPPPIDSNNYIKIIEPNKVSEFDEIIAQPIKQENLYIHQKKTRHTTRCSVFHWKYHQIHSILDRIHHRIT